MLPICRVANVPSLLPNSAERAASFAPWVRSRGFFTSSRELCGQYLRLHQWRSAGFRKKLQPPHILPTNEEQGNRSDRDPLRLEVWNSREWMLLVSGVDASVSLPEASPTNPWLGLLQVGYLYPIDAWVSTFHRSGL